MEGSMPGCAPGEAPFGSVTETADAVGAWAVDAGEDVQHTFQSQRDFIVPFWDGAVTGDFPIDLRATYGDARKRITDGVSYEWRLVNYPAGISDPEFLLSGMPVGDFLVEISEGVWWVPGGAYLDFVFNEPVLGVYSAELSVTFAGVTKSDAITVTVCHKSGDPPYEVQCEGPLR
jgi:hypothetical protein